MFKAAEGQKSITTLIKEGFAMGKSRSQIQKYVEEQTGGHKVIYQHVRNTEVRLGLKRTKGDE